MEASLTNRIPSPSSSANLATSSLSYQQWFNDLPTRIPQHLHHHHHERISAFQPVLSKFTVESIENSSSPPRRSPPSAVFNHHHHHHGHHHHVQQQQHDIDPNASAAAHLETIVSNMGTSKQGHLCIYCGKLYSRKYGLKIHIRTHTGFKPLKCKYCLRPFGDPSNLNKHVRLHVQGNTIYKCPECDKILVRRRDLQRHIQSRHTHQKCLTANDNHSHMVTFSSSSASSGTDSSDEGSHMQ